MSELLLLEVAKLLLKRWKNKAGLPSPIKLTAALERLLDRDLDLAKVLSVIKDPKDVDLGMLENEILEFQQDVGILLPDGILGTKTESAIRTAELCIKQFKELKNKVSPEFEKYLQEEKKAANKENWYLYYIDKNFNVPGITNPDQIIMNAWSKWQEYVDVKVERMRGADMKAAANVIIKTADLSGSVLGQANVGNPPGQYVLEIEMDSSRNWDEELFEGAVVHEIGHVLGLEHNRNSGLLMSPVVPRNWRSKMDNDGERAWKELSWLNPVKKQQAVQPNGGIFIFGDSL